MHDAPARLRPLVEWKREVSLVPFSGIQILDFGFRLADVEVKRRFVERTVGQRGDEVERMLVPLPHDVVRAAEMEALRSPDDPLPYSIDQDKALAPFLGAWVPVPVLRAKGDSGGAQARRFDLGPTSWARLRVVALEAPDPATGHTHRVQLALDTMLAASNPGDRYAAPDLDDVRRPAGFQFVSTSDQIGWFLSNPLPEAEDGQGRRDTQDWVSSWVRELFIAFKQQEDPGRPFREDRLRHDFEHWARYLQFLEVIDAAVAIPRFRFLNTLSSRDAAGARSFDAVPPVEVDLILDVGNSRTCGILVERFPDEAQVDLTRSYPLELRDLSRPEVHHSGLIESRVEFAELSFGKDRYAAASGRGNGFLWPSFVRIGPEARRLTQSETGTETTSGLSSPKRYLWDVLPARQDWRFHDQTDSNTLSRNTKAIMAFLNEAGDDLAEAEREIRLGLRRRQDTSPMMAIRPRFSRSALYAFMLSEIIAHALVQINDPGGRSRRRQTDLPRRLARIILTLPTATPVQEQKIIRSRATAALALVWKRLGIVDGASNISFKPELIVDWDEASCTQLVYLYSEITQRTDGRVDAYLDLKGRPRPHPATGRPSPSLRLACIDVGGGTTDLMITTYFGENDAVLEPVQTFREGFRVAGDDLVRKVIAQAVLPALTASAEAAGGRHVPEKLRELFAGNFGGQDQQFVQKRRQCVLRVLRPIATEIIAACEVAAPAEPVVVVLRDLLRLGPPPAGAGADPTAEPAPDPAPGPPPGPPDAVLRFLEDALRAQGASGWSLADVTLSVDRGEVDMLAREVFGTALGNMVEVIDHLGADIVLLTGRPSRLPVVRALVEEAMVVPPDRLVSMHRYRTDRWYPYRDPVSQRIGDPKSTVAVGGMLMALAGNRIPNFKVRTDACRMRSTARYIGVMDNSGRIRASRVLFSPPVRGSNRKAAAEATVPLNNPMQIGFRQLPLERWTTTPLYRLDFATEAARHARGPLRVRLERPEVDAPEDDATLEQLMHLEAMLEALEPTEVQDGAGEDMSPADVTLLLQTLGIDVEYWLDTGIIGD